METAKKILIINQFANTPDLPGHTRQYEIALGLVKRGWEVQVFSSDFNLTTRNFYKLKGLDLTKTELIKGINWHWLRVIPYKKNNYMRYLNLFSFCLNLAIQLSKFIFLKGNRYKMPDIILASSPQLPATFLCLLYAKIFRKPFISEIRDLWPQVLIDLGGISSKNTIIKVLIFIEKFIYKNSDYVVVLAKGAEKYVRNKGASNVVWLPNGPDLEKFKFSEIPSKKETFAFNRPFLIYYFGAHGIANGLENLIAASKLIADQPIKFILIGDGPSKKDLMLKSEKLKNIEFLNPIPKEDIPRIISKSDAILLSLKAIPLFKYGVSPNKLYDAYAIGRPVITTVEGEINNEVEKNFLGYTANGSKPKELADACLKLLNTPKSERIMMGKRARNLCEKVYSRKRIVDIYEKLFKQLI